jgi:hypothetical protein
MRVTANARDAFMRDRLGSLCPRHNNFVFALLVRHLGWYPQFVQERANSSGYGKPLEISPRC